MKIYSIIINVTDDNPYLHEKSFKTYEEADQKVLELGKEYVNDHGGEFSESDWCIYRGDYPEVTYSIEWTEI